MFWFSSVSISLLFRMSRHQPSVRHFLSVSLTEISEKLPGRTLLLLDFPKQPRPREGPDALSAVLTAILRGVSGITFSSVQRICSIA
jgi:hypothetical protein